MEMFFVALRLNAFVDRRRWFWARISQESRHICHSSGMMLFLMLADGKGSHGISMSMDFLFRLVEKIPWSDLSK